MERTVEELRSDIELAETMQLGIDEAFWQAIAGVLPELALGYEAQVIKTRQPLVDLNKMNFYKGIAIGLRLAEELPRSLIERGEKARAALRALGQEG